ncbi:MAG: hypothetical protein MRK01_15760 [Candidatus Scalindua sp.]|nr:hypothetical protein [Candidatus Scalindua sp.]
MKNGAIKTLGFCPGIAAVRISFLEKSKTKSVLDFSIATVIMTRPIRQGLIAPLLSAVHAESLFGLRELVNL